MGGNLTHDDLDKAARLLNSSMANDSSRAAVVEAWERSNGVQLPYAVRRFYSSPMSDRSDVANDDLLLPVEALTVSDADRWLGPGGRMITFLVENQHVCEWGFPLDLGGDPPVLLIEPRHFETGRVPIEVSPTFSHFIHAVAWDTARWAHPQADTPVVQAQAPAIDDTELGYVAAMFRPGPHTRGWPARHAFRFYRDDWAVLLWAAEDQCDWWVNAGSPESMRRLLTELFACPSLRDSAWSNDQDGNELIAEARGAAPPTRSLSDPPPDAETIEHLEYLRRFPTEPVALVEKPHPPEWEEMADEPPTLIVCYDDVICHEFSAAVDETVGLLLRSNGVWSAHREDCELIYLYGTPNHATVTAALDRFWHSQYDRYGVDYTPQPRRS